MGAPDVAARGSEGAVAVSTVAVIGLGRMGLPIAGTLLGAGYRVVVYNRTAEKARPLVEAGAVAVRSPAAAAAAARIVLTVVADDRAVDAVVSGDGGLLRGMGPDGIHVGMSTVEPATAARLDEAHRAHGSRYVAAPVFGRPEAAEQARLWPVVAGPAPAVEAALPVLAALSRGVSRVGEAPPRASLVKLAGNFLLAAALESLAEALALVEKGGLDRLEVLRVLNDALFGSPIYLAYGERMCRGAFSPAGFRMALGLKDVRLVLRTADDLEVPMPLASLVHDHFLSAVAGGRGDLDWAAVSETLRQAAAVRPA